MSLDLCDLKRLKVTPETRAALQGKTIQTGHSQQEIARDVLHRWAIGELDGARVLHALDPREGQGRDNGGHVRDNRGRRR